MNEKKVIEIKLEDILPNRFQPRLKFNESAIQELADSIKEHGVIQPIVVRQIADKYEIIAGERRYKASLVAGKEKIPAIVTDLNDKESAEVALIENVQRQNLTPIEEAISYKKILDMGYLTQDILANKLGKTQSTIANKLRLLNLEEDVQEALLNGKISERHARSLLKLHGKDQIELLNRIIKERLTVRATDLEVDKILNPKHSQVVENEINEEEPLMNQDFNVNFQNNDESIFKPQNNISNNQNNSIFKNDFETNKLPSFDMPSLDDKIDLESLNIPSTPIIEDDNSNKDFNLPFENLNSFDTLNFSNKETNDLESFTPAPISNLSFDNNSFDDISLENKINNVENTQNLENENFKVELNSSQPEEPNKFFNFDLIDDQIEEDDSTSINLNQQIPSFDLNESPFSFTPFQQDNSISLPNEENKEEKQPTLTSPIIFEPIKEDYNSNENLVEPSNFNQQVRFDGIKNINTINEKESKNNVQADIRTVVNTIRSCANTVQKFGYKVDVHEVEFTNTYQITFEIHKN